MSLDEKYYNTFLELFNSEENSLIRDVPWQRDTTIVGSYVTTLALGQTCIEDVFICVGNSTQSIIEFLTYFQQNMVTSYIYCRFNDTVIFTGEMKDFYPTRIVLSRGNFTCRSNIYDMYFEPLSNKVGCWPTSLNVLKERKVEKAYIHEIQQLNNLGIQYNNLDISYVSWHGGTRDLNIFKKYIDLKYYITTMLERPKHSHSERANEFVEAGTKYVDKLKQTLLDITNGILEYFPCLEGIVITGISIPLLVLDKDINNYFSIRINVLLQGREMLKSAMLNIATYFKQYDPDCMFTRDISDSLRIDFSRNMSPDIYIRFTTKSIDDIFKDIMSNYIDVSQCIYFPSTEKLMYTADCKFAWETNCIQSLENVSRDLYDYIHRGFDISPLVREAHPKPLPLGILTRYYDEVIQFLNEKYMDD